MTWGWEGQMDDGGENIHYDHPSWEQWQRAYVVTQAVAGFCPLCKFDTVRGYCVNPQMSNSWRLLNTMPMGGATLLGCQKCGWYWGCHWRSPGHEFCRLLGGCVELTAFAAQKQTNDEFGLMKWRLLWAMGLLEVHDESGA